MLKRKLNITDHFPSKKIKKDFKPFSDVSNINWNDYVSATQTRNYLMKDPLLDWFSYYMKETPSGNLLKGTSVKSPFEKGIKNFTEFIMSQGIEFESQIYQLIKNKFGDNVVNLEGNGNNARSFDKFHQTIEALQRGVPIIYSGVLHDYNMKTYGIPDLIIRSDWINKIIPDTLEEKYTNISSLFHSKYHYRIVDIKFTTLNLRSDGRHLLNTGSIPAYKGQLWVYTQMLANLQEYNPKESYILGRKWKYNSKKQTYKDNSCFSKFGVINYENVDFEYIEKTKQAVNWILKMRKEGHNWNFETLPLPVPELYPNMSNTHDFPWHSTKKKIASKIKEITSLWMCGVKQREYAHSNGIYKWDDKRCNSKTLGIKGEYISKILNEILDINKSEDDKIKPNKIKNNWLDWQNKKTIEFYVDFETITDVITDFSNLSSENKSDGTFIYMIGVGFIDPITSQWIYKNFTAETLPFFDKIKDDNSKDDNLVCKQFNDYVKFQTEKFSPGEIPLIIHWSNAEQSQWNNYVKNNEDKIVNLLEEFLWFDMLHLFKSEPIVIKDCFGFSLKEIVENMNKHNLINLKWEDSVCNNGENSILCAYEFYKNKNIFYRRNYKIQ